MSTNHKKLPATELLNTQLSVEQINTNRENYSEELIQRAKLGETAFEVVGNNENGYFIALGKYRLTEPFKPIETITHDTLASFGSNLLENKMWEIILNLLTLFQEFHTLDLINQGYITKKEDTTKS